MFASHGCSFIAARRVRQSPVWISSLWPSGSRKYSEGPSLRLSCQIAAPEAWIRAAASSNCGPETLKGDVGVSRQRRRPGPLVKRKAQPQIAGKEVGAFAPARQRLCSQCPDVKAERPVDVPHRKGDVIEATDHGAEIALRMANARMKVATAPSTEALTPR